MSPIKDRPLILYIAALDHSLGAMLAKHDDQGKETYTISAGHWWDKDTYP